ncbi:MAG: recombinase family protein [Dehalococcoidia bacterium]
MPFYSSRYARESHVQGYSLEAQRAEISRWCQRRSYELVKVYVEDGKSAHTDRIDRRPQLLALLEDAKSDQFDIVVSHMIDRWARNLGARR